MFLTEYPPSVHCFPQYGRHELKKKTLEKQRYRTSGASAEIFFVDRRGGAVITTKLPNMRLFIATSWPYAELRDLIVLAE